MRQFIATVKEPKTSRLKVVERHYAVCANDAEEARRVLGEDLGEYQLAGCEIGIQDMVGRVVRAANI